MKHSVLTQTAGGRGHQHFEASDQLGTVSFPIPPSRQHASLLSARCGSDALVLYHKAEKQFKALENEGRPWLTRECGHVPASPAKMPACLLRRAGIISFAKPASRVNHTWSTAQLRFT